MSDEITVAFHDGVARTVSGLDCQQAAELHELPWTYVTIPKFFETVRLLMLAGFCLLFLVGCSQQPALTAWQLALRDADNAILTTAEATHSTVKEQTAKLDAIATKLDTLEASLVSKSETVQSGQEVITESVADTSPDKNAQDSQTPAQGSSAESGDVPLFVYVTPFCQPCERLKNDWKDGKLKGFDVKFCAQTEAHAQQLIDSKIDRDRVIIYVGSGESRDKLIAKGVEPERIIVSTIDPKPYPAIAYKSADSETGWKFHSPHGYGPRILMELRATLLGKDTPVVREFPQAAQTEMPRSIDLVGLHNQLHGGGNWTWPGDLATHLQSTHGVMLNGTAQGYSGNQIISSRSAVRSFPRGTTYRSRSNFVSRSSCPSGRCP